MAFQVAVTRRADNDIANAEAWLAKVGPAALQRWRSRMFRAIQSLERDPHRCPQSEDAARLGVDLRELISGRPPHVYRIYFTIDGLIVTVLRVRHAAQDQLEAEDV